MNGNYAIGNCQDLMLLQAACTCTCTGFVHMELGFRIQTVLDFMHVLICMETRLRI